MPRHKFIITHFIAIFGLFITATGASSSDIGTKTQTYITTNTIDDLNNQKPIPGQKTHNAPSDIPILIPEKKGANAEPRVLSNIQNSTNEELLEAVHSGDIQSVNRVLQAGKTNLHQRDVLGRTSLILAAQRGYTDIVNTLLDAGSDPNAKDQQNKTALAYAAMAGNEKVVKRLVSARANIEVVDDAGRTPLIYAVTSRNSSAVSILLKAGADANHQDLKGISPLIYSLDKGNPKISQMLINAGADIDVILKKSRVNTLILAARAGDTSIIKLLIIKGMDINSASSAGVTPLMTAISYNHKDAAKLLIDSGANINTKNKIGRSAIFYSTHTNIDADIVKMLVEKGANINEIEKNGFTPLTLAVANGNTGAVKVLVDSGLSASGTGLEGEFTPLMSAAANNQPAVVELLLRYKPDVNIQDKRGKTALVWAAKHNCLICVELLLKNGASVELADGQNKSALDYAKQNKKSKNIVEVLETQKAKNN